jgi:hypothetical protein
MASRARITLGIALLLAVLAMIIREIQWLAALLTLFGLFLIVWGRLPSETEKWIAQLPGGEIILKGLDELDTILVPREPDAEKHLREIIERYDARRRASLKQLIITRNASLAGSDWTVFNQDGLVISTFSGPGPVREEFRDPIKRILRDLGT